jgi:hypothetical protein
MIISARRLLGGDGSVGVEGVVSSGLHRTRISEPMATAKEDGPSKMADVQ